MNMTNHHAVPNSEQPVLRKSTKLGPVSHSEQVDFVVHLRNRNELPDDDSYLQQGAAFLTAEEFEENHGMAPDDQAIVEEFAETNGLEILQVDSPGCSLQMRGSVDAVNEAFRTELHHREDAHGQFRSHDGPVHVPTGLANVVVGVVGLGNHSRLDRIRAHSAGPIEEEYMKHAYFPREVGALYDFPLEYDGEGQTVGILEFGGGYFRSDIDGFFGAQHLRTPEILSVPSHRGLKEGSPSGMNLWDWEVATDLQIAGSIAPGAKFVLYYGDSKTADYLTTTYNRAVFDTVHRPSVISISYGGAEGLFSKHEMDLFNRTARAAAMMGITTCVSSGDAGSASSDYHRFPLPATHVNFPACSPLVLACGGTALFANEDRTTIAEETVWNTFGQCVASSGGGISTHFAMPQYQTNVDVPKNATIYETFRGRGIPDVAGNAAFETCYKLMLHGRWIPGAGTSAVAPLWAGLISLLNEATGTRCGHINPFLYRLAGTSAFRDVHKGYNGAYSAQQGWDACTGLGSPNAKELLRALQTTGSKVVPAKDQTTSTGLVEAATSFARAALASANAAASAAESAKIYLRS